MAERLPVLTPKQELFVEEYLIDLNATRAALAAGYSPKNRNGLASNVLKSGAVLEAIRIRKGQLLKEIKITQQMVIAELAKIGFSNIGDVLDWDEKGVKILSNIPADVKAAISDIVITKSGIKVKMHDKGGALDKLARHLGLYDMPDDPTDRGTIFVPVMTRDERNSLPTTPALPEAGSGSVQ